MQKIISGPEEPPLAARAPRQRGSSDKTGQATRERYRELILQRWGPYCWLCLRKGKSTAEALIDLTLKHPDPMSFSRDHVIPRSHGGTDRLGNQRPAHNICNQRRGNALLHRARRTK